MNIINIEEDRHRAKQFAAALRMAAEILENDPPSGWGGTISGYCPDPAFSMWRPVQLEITVMIPKGTGV